MKQLVGISLFAVIFSFAFFGVAFAVTGTISPSSTCSANNCAWSSGAGWINFAPTDGSGTYKGLTITDTAISGYAWSQNYGWINFSPSNGGVSNNTSGALSGYAWGQNVGWVNFTGAKIDCTGQFSGSASGDISGVVNFSCANCKVITNWHATSACNTGGITVNKTTVGGSGTFSFNATGAGYNDFSIVVAGSSGSNTQTGLAPGNYSATETVLSGWTKTQDTCNSITVVAGQIATCSVTNEKGIVATPTPTSPPPPEASPLVPLPTTTPLLPSTPVQPADKAIEKTTDVLKAITDPLKQLLNQPGIDVVSKKADQFVNSPAGSAVTRTVTTTAVAVTAVTTATTTAAATVVTTGAVSLPSVFEVGLTVVRLWGILLTALGIRKKVKYWGTVYDSVTKQPLDPAQVLLKDQKGNDIAFAVTDIDGRYGFLVSPGSYQILAKKTNYAFPSQKLAGKTSDEIYNNLYFGETIDLKLGEVLGKNIPMDAVKFDWNEFAKKSKTFMKFYSKYDALIRKISDLFYIIGFFLALIAFIYAPYPYNTIIFVAYLTLLALRIFGLRPKSFGYIVEKATKLPLSFAIVRVMMPGTNVEISNKVADAYGRYYCLIPRGKYYLKIEKKNPDSSYTLVYTSEVIDASKKGIIKKKFEV